MAISDPLSDLLTRIRNGQRNGFAVVSSPASHLRGNVLDVLQREGYIRGYERQELEAGMAELSIELKYYEGAPVIKKIWRVSRPGKRGYSSIRDLPRVRDGLGISILSTSRGVMSDKEARNANVGGEVLCNVI